MQTRDEQVRGQTRGIFEVVIGMAGFEALRGGLGAMPENSIALLPHYSTCLKSGAIGVEALQGRGSTANHCRTPGGEFLHYIYLFVKHTRKQEMAH